jgi:hypothetical protein
MLTQWLETPKVLLTMYCTRTARGRCDPSDRIRLEGNLLPERGRCRHFTSVTFTAIRVDVARNQVLFHAFKRRSTLPVVNYSVLLNLYEP